jgi:cytochrome c
MKMRNRMRLNIPRAALKCLGLTTFGLLAAPSALQAASPDPVAGAVVFKKCASCHNVDPSGRNGLGPNLRGVVGRASGKAPGFNYSPAMTAAKLVWTDKNLMRFLASPRQAVPGTRMTFLGLSSPQDQANVIAFLKASAAAKK